jgi:endonuclease/exonuclease/phosphatase family metal-dependent hydrolase
MIYSSRPIGRIRFGGSIAVIVLTLSGLLLSVAECETIRVASYNVRNYLTMDRLIEGKWRPEYPKPESEKRYLREAILEVRPDILALQEMGSKKHLEELRRDLANEGLVYTGSAWLEAHDTERHVAALWNGEIRIEVRSHRDLPIKYRGVLDHVKRGMLELRVADEQGGWSLFNAHLKSKYTTVKSDPLSNERRTLEGRAVRDRIIKLFPDLENRRYLIVGDLNDSPVSGALRALRKKGKRVLSVPIEFSDESGDRWTHYYKKEDSYSRIDFMLRSPGWHELERILGVIRHSRDYYKGSDHRLIWVDLPID